MEPPFDKLRVNNFPIGLTFDDVLLLPGYSDFSRSEIDLSTNLTKKIKLSLPFVSAPMDTVTESKLAIALAQLGGIGIIHRNLAIRDQALEVRKVKKAHSTSSGQALLVGAAIGASKGFEERVEALVKAGSDVIVVDSAHGFSKGVINAVQFIKKTYPKMQVIAGNIATSDGAKALIAAGADGLRVGMGPGAICTTRVISGMGVPQITALLDIAKIAKKEGIPLIADGGIKYSGDMVKALAAGASTVMMGGFFASAEESPGKTVALTREFIPKRFLSVFDKTKKLLPTSEKKDISLSRVNKEVYHFKEYRGMGSMAAMQKGVKIKSEGEFHGKDYKDRILVAEGVEGLVPIKGSVKELVDQAIGGIKSGMYYTGAKTIPELWQKVRFIQITQASLRESHPHSVLITNPGENYS
ncbi:MAG: IMP dehydrogenase [Candidatus Levybacteria bacterium]|nr:IMP dehydrogenase [Candidatus Levybacteria bacterium]MBI3092785.1 IMP dehydrogenase [Candidatus Levybacteria bacterium]